MKTQLSVLKRESLDDYFLDSFVEIFNRIKTTTWHDYTVESLYKGLLWAGRENQARAIVTAFVDRDRRDQGSLSIYLQSIVNDIPRTTRN